MIQQQNLPAIGDSVTEAEVISWLVDVGDTVAVDEDVVEVMTDKATVTIPSPWKGVLHATHAEPGDVLQVGDPLFSIDNV